MSSWIDINYAKQISYRLEGWKEKKFSPFLAVCRCPICGDSKKKNKKRFYLYEHKNHLVAKCFNCDYSTSFGNFLKGFDPNLYNRYTLENYSSGATRQNTRKDADISDMFKTAFPESSESIVDDLKSIAELDGNHPAKKYVVDRLIPKEMYSKLFYAPKFFKWAAKSSDKFDGNSKKDHPRLVIPWYSADNKIVAYTARTFGHEQPKYYKVVLVDDHVVYGLDRTSNPQFCLEGPIDSMFLPDCIAVGNASLHTYNFDGIYIPDSDIRNKEIMKEVKKLISMGKKVCMLPSNNMFKDINEAIQLGLNQEDLLDIINKNTYSGLTAELKFIQWSKVK